MSKKSNKELVINFLMTKILKGTLKPGTPLRELHIAKELSLSQAPVREALLQMEGEGFVQYKPRCGCSVRAYTSEELLATYDVREALESFALTRCAKVISEKSHREKLSKILNEFKLVENISQFSEVDFRFHRALIELTNNALYYTIWRKTMNSLQIATAVKQIEIDLGQAVEEHIQMGELLLKGNTQEVVIQLQKHYDKLRNKLKGELQ